MKSLLQKIILLFLVGFALYACGPRTPKNTIALEEKTFSDLKSWEDDQHEKALSAFLTSCGALLKKPHDQKMALSPYGGTVSDWHEPCQKAQAVEKTPRAARLFFEDAFTPFSVSINNNPEGLFTGYYEPLLHGSLTKTDRFSTPLHKKPDDLITINLGQFRPELKGMTLAGALENGQLIPYAHRTDIVEGALDDKNLELLWVDDPVDAFFLQVQGSGRVMLDDGTIVRVGYAGKNGHVYKSIGKILIDEGALDPEIVSLGTIKKWLEENPDQKNRILNANPSYVFFRLLEGEEGPFGSAGVVLTAERSLAIDPVQLPLNAPVWLETTHPNITPVVATPTPFNRLMIAQDTGGAIKGAIRGDVFWGFGDKAESIAGRMANKGRYYLLLPNGLAEKIKRDKAGE